MHTMPPLGTLLTVIGGMLGDHAHRLEHSFAGKSRMLKPLRSHSGLSVDS